MINLLESHVTRRRTLAARLLKPLGRSIGFVDVGSGGPLKEPWASLPAGQIAKFDFDPEALSTDGLPVCISDKSGRGQFNVAVDPRSSSVHQPNGAFVDRFGMPEICTARTIDVSLRTLDELFINKAAYIDIMDINVEGHDWQVVEGGKRLLTTAFLKLIKIEFELAEVWLGQGWFSDIDRSLRGLGFDLVRLEPESAQPVVAKGLPVGFEPIWGKAYYIPGTAAWMKRKITVSAETFTDDALMGMALYTLFDLPGRALDVAMISESVTGWTSNLLRRELDLVYANSAIRSAVARVLPAPLRRLVKRVLNKWL